VRTGPRILTGIVASFNYEDLDKYTIIREHRLIFAALNG
jgi:hypothetical protein